MTEWEKYAAASWYLDEGLIRRDPPPEDQQRPARKRREWMEWFLPHLDQPQRAYPAVQVAGTSGKGSVAVMVAEILRAVEQNRSNAVRICCHDYPKLKEWIPDHETGGTQQLYYPRVNKKVVIKSLSIPIPIYVNIDYKITLKSEYQQQMNEMLAPFIARTGQINAFTMTRNGHLYEAFIDQGFAQANNVNDLQEEMRMYTSEVTIKVLGYLIGEGDNDDRPIVAIHENAVEVSYPNEGIVPEGNDDFFL